MNSKQASKNCTLLNNYFEPYGLPFVVWSGPNGHAIKCLSVRHANNSFSEVSEINQLIKLMNDAVPKPTETTQNMFGDTIPKYTQEDMKIFIEKITSLVLQNK